MTLKHPDDPRFTPALATWQYEILTALAHDGPLTGGELCRDTWVSRFGWSPMVAGIKLAAIQRTTQFVTKDETGIWRITPRGRIWLNGGVE